MIVTSYTYPTEFFFNISYNTKALLLQLKYKILHKNIIVPLLGIFSTAVQTMVIGLVKKKKKEREIDKYC